jgi:tripartite-type tricarboxylate transporter receptor subunit TctC
MSMQFMRSSRRALLAALAATIAGLTCPAMAQSQDWPNRPVTIIVPYGPGASNDTFTRMLAQILTKQLGQPFIVQNRPGAGGFIGSDMVAKAAPDGYTFLEMPSSIAGFKPIMKVDLDPLKNLAPIGLLARSPAVMVVPASLPVKSVKEFIEYARARPDQVFYGMAGIGTTNHQQAEMFKAATGIKMTGVNYKSAADVMNDLIAGRVQVMFTTTASARGHVEAGQLRLLAYSDTNYPAESLKAPTLAESGVPGMEVLQTWWAVFGPPALPADIKRKMNAAINVAQKDPDFAAMLSKAGATPAPVSVEETIETVKQEIALVEKLPKMTEP